MQELTPNHPETPEQLIARLNEIAREGNKYAYKARLQQQFTDALEPLGWTLYKFDPDPRSNTVTASRRKLLAGFWKLIITHAVPVAPLTYQKVAEKADKLIAEDPECDRELAEEIALNNYYRELVAELAKQLEARKMDSKEALVLATEISGGYTSAQVHDLARETLPVYYDSIIDYIRNRGRKALQDRN